MVFMVMVLWEDRTYKTADKLYEIILLWQTPDTQIDTAMQQLVINSMRYFNKENMSPL
jgi:hypothetical protein